MKEAGTVAPVLRGDYDSTATYNFYHVVTHNNILWICKVDGTVGIEPTEENSNTWYKAIDGNISDAQTLEGNAASYFATAQSVTDIISGTTPAGNASKLGGLSADSYMLSYAIYLPIRTDILAYVENDENVPISDPNVTLAYFRVINCPTVPTTYGYSADDNDFIYRIEKLTNDWIAVTARDIRSTQTFYRVKGNGTWFDWIRSNDGGNADTVDGYHASEWFLHSLGETINLNITDIASLPNGKWAFFEGQNMFTDFPQSLTNKGLIYGIIVVNAHIDNPTGGYKSGTILGTNAAGTSCEAVHFWVNTNNNRISFAEYLPLTGGTLSDWLSIAANKGLRQVITTEDGQNIRMEIGLTASGEYNIYLINDTIGKIINGMWIARGGSVFKRNADTEGWNEFIHTGNVGSYALPIGGGQCTGEYVGVISAVGNKAQLHAVDNWAVLRNVLTDGSFHDLGIKDGVVRFLKYATDGACTMNVEILHTGNSAKVVKATSAPSDTTAVWIDTANKVSKIYKDGAWTALA